MPLESLVPRLYDAVLQQELLPDILRDACRAMGVPAGGISFQSLGEGGGVHQVWVGLQPEFEAAYVGHYWQHDPWRGPSFHQPVGRFTGSQELVTAQELSKNAFYNELCRPHHLRDILGAPLFKSDSLYVAFAMMREERPGGAPGPTEALAARLIPHLVRATRLMIEHASLRAERDAALGSLARADAALLLVDADCRIVGASPAAEALLREGDGVCAVRDRLALIDPEANRALGALVGATAAGDPARMGGTTRAPRTQAERRPLLLVVAPTAGAPVPWAPEVFARRRVLVHLIDPDRPLSLPEERLRLLFELTPAESKLACLLAQDVPLAEAARTLGRSLETVRAQLKRIFEKTGTRRQPSLVALLARLAL